jgi:hypothetical protein
MGSVFARPTGFDWRNGKRCADEKSLHLEPPATYGQWVNSQVFSF